MPAQIFATTQAKYTDALTIALSQQIKEIDFLVSSPNFATAQVAKIDKSGAPQWDANELAIEPGSGSYQNIYGIRFRSFDPANATVVKAIAYFADDPLPQGFVPSSSQFSTSGQNVTGGTVITGIIPATGTTPIAGTGFSYTHVNASGLYVFTFTTPFASRPTISVTPNDDLARQGVSAKNVTGSGFSMQTVNVGVGVGDVAFNFVAQDTV